MESGLDENDAAEYADGIRRGGTLVTIRVMGQDRDHYEDILSFTDGRGPGGYDSSGMPVQLHDIGQGVRRS